MSVVFKHTQKKKQWDKNHQHQTWAQWRWVALEITRSSLWQAHKTRTTIKQNTVYKSKRKQDWNTQRWNENITSLRRKRHGKVADLHVLNNCNTNMQITPRNTAGELENVSGVPLFQSLPWIWSRLNSIWKGRAVASRKGTEMKQWRGK